MKPRVLSLIATCAMAIPLAVSSAAEIVMLVIPGCMVQLYGDNLCFVGSINLAGPLFTAAIAGYVMFFILTFLVSLPLFVIAAFLTLHNRSTRKRPPSLQG